MGAKCRMRLWFLICLSPNLLMILSLSELNLYISQKKTPFYRGFLLAYVGLMDIVLYQTWRPNMAVCRKPEGCCRKCGNLHPGRNSESQWPGCNEIYKIYPVRYAGEYISWKSGISGWLSAMGSHGTGTVPMTTALLL